MIAHKMFRCSYTLDLSGKACEGIINNAKDFNLFTIRILSNFFNSDIEAINALDSVIDNIQHSIGNDQELLREFNPEFYPTMNVDNMLFDPEVSTTATDHNTELLTIKASKNFDEAGDFKNMRISLETDDFKIKACVLAEPEEYMLEKQKAVMQDKGFSKTITYSVH